MNKGAWDEDQSREIQPVTELSCGWVKVSLDELCAVNSSETRTYSLYYGDPFSKDRGSEIPKTDLEQHHAKSFRYRYSSVPFVGRSTSSTISLKVRDVSRQANMVMEEAYNTTIGVFNTRLPKRQLQTAIAQLPRNLILPAGGAQCSSILMTATYCYMLRQSQLVLDTQHVHMDPVLAMLPDLLDDPAMAAALWGCWAEDYNKEFHTTVKNSRVYSWGANAYAAATAKKETETEQKERLEREKAPLTHIAAGQNAPPIRKPSFGDTLPDVWDTLRPILHRTVITSWPVFCHSQTMKDQGPGREIMQREYISSFDSIREVTPETFEDFRARVRRIEEELRAVPQPLEGVDTEDPDWTRHVATPGNAVEKKKTPPSQDAEEEKDRDYEENVQLFTPFNTRELAFGLGMNDIVAEYEERERRLQREREEDRWQSLGTVY